MRRQATTLSNYGLSIAIPSGWDGEIWRDPDGDTHSDSSIAKPVVQAANFALPATRGDFGSGAVEMMRRGGVLLCVLEYEEASASTPLFSGPMPSELAPREFGPTNLQRPLPGQAGAQRFVNSGGRAFCVYAVIGNYKMRQVLVPELNRVLATVVVTPLAD